MNSSRIRASLLFFILSLGFGFVALRSIQFQLKTDVRLKRMAQEKAHLTHQQMNDDLITSRGVILDRNGRDLALSIITKSYFANPKLIKNPDVAAQKLSPIIKTPAAKLRSLLRQERYFVWLKREVDESVAEKIDALHLEGVYFKKESRRAYPNGELGRQVLGVAGYDGIGLEGLEKTYDPYLRTSDKSEASGIRDALGRLLRFDDFEQEWFATDHIVSTLDIRIQKILEDELRSTLQEKNADLAEGILMNPKTGEVLAMASIDGRALQTSESSLGLRNRSISDSYEPGSTFKIILAASGLTHLGLNADSQIYGENGSFTVGNHTIKEYHGHKFGWLTLQELLEVSSNIAAAKVGLKLGNEALGGSIESFGFGNLTGIDLPGEAVGIVRSPSSWRPIELANISFGQGIAVTPLQIARAVSAVANGGYLVQPHLVSKIMAPRTTDSEARVVWQPKVEKEEVLTAEQSRALVNMLIHVTEKGSTGAEAAIPGYEVAGKTGTSEKLVETRTPKGRIVKTYSLEHSIVSFVGFVPAYDPAFLLLVIYDNPKGRSSGGNTAAPSFRRIAGRALTLLGIPPTRSSPLQQELSSNVHLKATSKFVGKSFQEVIRELKDLSPEERARYDLIGYGVAIREEEDREQQRTKVFFK